jgi:GNAT superfamily N-acetyltransferase
LVFGQSLIHFTEQEGMSVTIRTLTPADLDVADAIQAAAYGSGTRRAQLEMYLQLQPDGWILASLDGVPAGLAGATSYGALAHVGLVSVLPAMQRRGVAQAMMAYLLDWLASQGNPLVALDASPAGAPLYERLDFVDDDKTVVYLRDDCPTQPRVSERVAPMRQADLAEVAALDEPIFGAARVGVLRSLLGQVPDRAFVSRDARGEIDAYLFAQANTIGPWAARPGADCEGLLVAALRLDFDGPPRVLVPSSNATATPLLMAHGFSPRRSLRHMRRGGTGPVGRREMLYGLASFAIG